jgi:protein-tyrosine kinase
MNAVVERPANLVPRPVRSAARAVLQTGAGETGLDRKLVAALDGASARAEALRELRSELILRWFGDKRTLAVLGARAADDADSVAANLAIVMAQLGEPTLLIDANLRAPCLHALFGLQPAIGLTDLLRNRDVHDEAILRVQSIDNLWLLPAGPAVTNPQELVSRTPFIYLMKTLPERFRAVIVATPPALPYADAQVIAARAEGCLLVTRRHRTRVADVVRIKEQLAAGKTALLGGVVRE